MIRVLVAGANGNLGKKVVRALADRGAFVRALVRRPAEIERANDVAIAELADTAALGAACREIDVVVSTMQGLRDVIVDGQTALLRACEIAGVQRMIPSDYALDFFKTKPGANRNLDLRREFSQRVLDASIVQGTSILCGAFMELIAPGRIGPDAEGVYRVFGDPDQMYDFTTTGDLARYIAAVALDRSAPRYVRIAGDTISPRQLADLLGAKLVNAGSVEQLSTMIERMRASDPAETTTFPVWQQMQYARDMASGAGKLDPLDNARYPDIVPTTVRALLQPKPHAE